MKNILETKFVKKYTDIIVLFLVGIVCSVLGFFNVFSKMEFRLYDIMLKAGRSPKQDERILMIDINDLSIDDIGVWPWSRDIIADILLRVKEFGANNIIFDIEYLQRSSNTMVPNANSIIDESIETSKQVIESIVTQFSDAAASGAYSPNELHQISDMMVNDYISPTLSSIKEKTLGLSRDNDDYFARALQFFGNSWITINTGMVNELDDMKEIAEDDITDEQKQFMQARDYALEKDLYHDIKDPYFLIDKGNALTMKEQKSYRGYTPARDRFLRAAIGAGATNVVVDKDGLRRRIELFHHLNPEKNFLWTLKDGKYTATPVVGEYYAPQLALAPLMNYLKVKNVERTLSAYILRGAEFPNAKKPTDIRIPVDSKGRMLINWLHSRYEDSFKSHAYAAFVYELDRAEERLYQNLNNITRYRITDDFGYDLPYYQYGIQLINTYRQIGEMKDALLEKCQGYSENNVAIGDGILQEEYDAYFSLRNSFYDQIKQYIEASLDQNIAAILKQSDDGTDPEYTDQVEHIIAEMNAYFTGLTTDYQTFKTYYDDLAAKFKDSLCFIGITATSSTDIGVTPFDSQYPNLGTHGNVMNTILQRDFITPVPSGVGIAFAFLITLGVSLKIREKSNGKKNVLALSYVIITTGVLASLMIMFKIYVPIFIPLLLVISSYISAMIVNFIAVERDRNTLRRGFDAYVSPEVVSQIVKDPSHLSLGGANKNITALFSDVKSFSGFTEMINNEEGETNGAVRLVAILNEYLGLLSDAIMDNKGTIDKYVGDEIVSFFGAPVDDEYNAFNACVAGIRMKQVETEYNAKHYYTDHDIPAPLLSRVGLNTGYMVVGNMGTEKKLNYTIMGNNVNLASRLEGTNKAYGSWIMCSEATWKNADSGEKSGMLLSRSFDCVQVINVKKPVQLYNILGLKSELSKEQIEAAEIFNAGMKLYLNGRNTPTEKKNIDELKQAYKLFAQAEACYSEDKSSAVFMDRCKEFITNGLPDVWDGVYVMKSK